MIAVQDENYKVAIQKLRDSGFNTTHPRREPPPEIMQELPDPQAVLDEINAGYKRLDQFSTTFNYPNSRHMEEQVTLIPSSFVHLPPTNSIQNSNDYDIYGNLLYPLERAMIASLVEATVDDENTGLSSWGGLIRSWISLMVGYLDVNCDILDGYPDSHVVEWFSTRFGRIHEAKHGPFDRRISKRLGSKKEMPIDVRGNILG
jgi:hypothetical protein